MLKYIQEKIHSKINKFFVLLLPYIIIMKDIYFYVIYADFSVDLYKNAEEIMYYYTYNIYDLKNEKII